MGDTATSVNQGGASGSTGIQFGGKQMRMAAAEARRVLLDMAAEKLGTPADQLIVVNGVVSAAFNRDKKTTYAELIGGKYFNVQLDWNKQIGNALYAPGKAQPKKHTEYKIVGKSIQRDDIAPKVFAHEDFVTDIKVPGMVHGRMIRPPVAGAVPVKVDEGSIKDIPGAQGGLGQGLPRRGRGQGMGRDQGRAEAQGRVVAGAAPPFPDQAALYDHIRKAPARQRKVEKENGNVDEAFRNAARVVEAEYEWPFQSHACMGPALRRGRDQGRQGHGLDRLAEVALRAATASPTSSACRSPRCEGISMPVPGAYGRNDAGDALHGLPPCWRRRSASRCACSTSRDEGTGWDPKGPASIHSGPRGDRRAAATSSPTSSSARASRACDVQHQRGSRLQRHAGRPLARRRR